jgi:hypothetical protein
MRTALSEGNEAERSAAAREIARWVRSATTSGENFSNIDAFLPLLTEAALTDPALCVRKTASLALRWSNDSDAVYQIARDLKSERPERRVAAAVVLGWIADDAATSALRICLNQDTEIVRVFAALALIQIGHQTPLPENAAALIAAAALNETERVGRQLAVAALDEVPGARDIFFAPIESALRDGDFKGALRLLESRSAACHANYVDQGVVALVPR